MKKLGMGLAIFMLICLCGCSSGAKRQPIGDNPRADIRESLNLDAVQNGVSINKELDRTKAFYDVLVASDIPSSLFYQKIVLDEFIESDRLKQIDLKVLYFNANIPSNDVVNFLKEMNQENNGITTDKIGVTFKEEENVSSTLFTKLAITNSVSLPKDFSVKDSDPVELVVAYLPVYCIYNDGVQDYTKVFLFVPVYYAFSYQSSSNEYTSGLKEYKLELEKVDNTYLLPSESTAA
ncbi:hypothetical protein HDR67_03080 [bacterium]|nr:hypothetical protein [bacterium]